MSNVPVDDPVAAAVAAAPAQPSIGQQLGLGQHWVPAMPVSYGIGSMQLPDGRKLMLLRFETTSGVFAVSMTPEDLAHLGNQCLDQAGSLVRAQPGDLPGLVRP